MEKIGKGNVTSGKGCKGVLRVVESVPDVLRLLKEDPTIMTPLFPRIIGVLCTSGGPTSHVAIVAREFDLACVMGVEFSRNDKLDGCAIHVSAEGEIFAEP